VPAAVGGGWAFSAVGVVVCGLATAAAGIAAIGAAFGNSYCSQGPTAKQVHDLHLALAVIAALWAAVPATVGVVAHLQRRRSEVWFCVAAVCALVGFGIAVSAQPSSWCF
jgi:hypothetical protein